MAELGRRSKTKQPETASSGSALMTPKQVAEYLNVTESQVYTLMREGDLLALKIGRRGVWRVDRKELERYIERLKEAAVQRVEMASRNRTAAKKRPGKKRRTQ